MTYLKTNLINRSSIKAMLASTITKGEPLNILKKYGKFLGYRAPNDGPGDGFWDYILNLHEQIGFCDPIVVVWLSNNQLSDRFCADCNDGMDYGGDRYLLQVLNNQASAIQKKGAYNLNYYWFHSTDASSPATCKDAYNWIQKKTGGAITDGGPFALFYYPHGDQSKWFSFSKSPSVESFKTKLQAWVSKLNVISPDEAISNMEDANTNPIDTNTSIDIGLTESEQKVITNMDSLLKDMRKANLAIGMDSSSLKVCRNGNENPIASFSYGYPYCDFINKA